jgi:ABC-type Na+ efflux pump permease subunit
MKALTAICLLLSGLCFGGAFVGMMEDMQALYFWLFSFGCIPAFVAFLSLTE